MNDWSPLDRRLAALERPSTDRTQLIALLRTSQLRLKPGAPVSQYMACLAAPDGQTLCLEYSHLRPHLWFGPRHGAALAAAGFVLERKPPGQGRHSGLNTQEALAGQEAFGLKAPSADEARRALDVLGLLGALRLDPGVVDRWVEKLRRHFPGFEAFEPADPAFAEREVDYKLAVTAKLAEGLATATTAEDRVRAAHEALRTYNLLFWMVPAKLAEDWPKERVGAAIGEIAAAGPEELVPGMAAFVAAFMADAPEPSFDAARQLAGAIAMHLHPGQAIYFRKTVRDDLYREATHRPFPRTTDAAEVFAEELAFARAVERALAERNLRPRSLLDVQSALWVVHSYTDADDAPAQRPDAAPVEPATMTRPLNTILYGPPGTGKTFVTARRAVEICDGSAPAEEAAVRARYAGLVAQKRIEFVTFHQSYGYEEFVEGLRPVTPEGGAGFSLEPVDGVLKRIAERAASRKATEAGSFDPKGKRVFKVSLGRSNVPADAYIRDECFEEDVIRLGYGGTIDWSGPEYSSFDAVLDGWRRLSGDPGATGYNPNVVQIWQLRVAMRAGDVVLASRGNRAIQGIGVVTGDYAFDAKRTVDEYVHLRPVHWLWTSDAAGALDVGEIYGKSFSPVSIYQCDTTLIRWDNLLPWLDREAADARPLPHVLVIDEINRANISKVLGELITLLEEDKRAGAPNALEVILPHSGKPFVLPPNLHILGTMNTADRSIALMDTALRRRFHFEEVAPNPALLAEVEVAGLDIDLPAMLEAINERLEFLLGPDHLLGHGWFMGVADRAGLDAVMGRKVIPLLREYFHEDLGRVRAVLGGGDGFVRAQPLSPPPGMAGDLIEPRWRHVDRYARDGGYAAEAWAEITAAAAP